MYIWSASHSIVALATNDHLTTDVFAGSNITTEKAGSESPEEAFLVHCLFTALSRNKVCDTVTDHTVSGKIKYRCSKYKLWKKKWTKRQEDVRETENIINFWTESEKCSRYADSVDDSEQ